MESPNTESPANEILPVSLDNLPAEVLERVPAACIDCSTAKVQTYRGRFNKECPGPVSSIEIAGQLITGQFCRYGVSE